MKLLPTCREISRLVSEGQDRELGTFERVRLRVHLSMCAGCTHFAQHMRLLRASMQRMSDDERR